MIQNNGATGGGFGLVSRIHNSPEGDSSLAREQLEGLSQLSQQRMANGLVGEGVRLNGWLIFGAWKADGKGARRRGRQGTRWGADMGQLVTSRLRWDPGLV